MLRLEDLLRRPFLNAVRAQPRRVPHTPDMTYPWADQVQAAQLPAQPVRGVRRVIPHAEDVPAENLSSAAQRRLMIAIALATDPELLLLDEPIAGMGAAEIDELMGIVSRIRDRGVSILLIEHNMKVVMGVSDRIAVLNYGLKIAEGPPEEIANNEAVIEAYLGRDTHAPH